MKEIKMVKLEQKNNIIGIECFAVNGGSTQLHQIYESLNCDLIDIVHVRFGNEVYSIICDDEGLLVDKPYICVLRDGKPWLAGSVLITRYDSLGNNIGLTDDDIERIISYTESIIVRDKHDRTYGAYNLITKGL
jgi:hypothetical protein